MMTLGEGVMAACLWELRTEGRKASLHTAWALGVMGLGEALSPLPSLRVKQGRQQARKSEESESGSLSTGQFIYSHLENDLTARVTPLSFCRR